MGVRTGRFRRSDRLLRPAEFRRVAHRGQRSQVESLVVLALRGTSGDALRPPRLGITMSRKVGGAVARNRVKRGVREWFRQRRGELASDLDLLVIGRRSAASLSTPELREALDAAARRAGAWSR